MSKSALVGSVSMEEEQDHDEDEAVILRCQQGDRHAFGLLVEKYMKRGYFCALGIVKSHEAALDLSQEAFVRAFKAIRRFDVKQKFFTWYYRILRNLCLNAVRDKKRHTRAFSEMASGIIERVPDSGCDAAEQMERQELQEQVWHALNSLKKIEREIIILKDFQDFSYKEIAEVLDCPLGTVMSRLYNARQALKNKLQRYFDER